MKKDSGAAEMVEGSSFHEAHFLLSRGGLFDYEWIMYQGERRKHRRVLMHNHVGLQLPGDITWMEAKAIDIGYGGIGLYSPKRLPVGREVVIRMGFLNTEDVVAPRIASL